MLNSSLLSVAQAHFDQSYSDPDSSPSPSLFHSLTDNSALRSNERQCVNALIGRLFGRYDHLILSFFNVWSRMK